MKQYLIVLVILLVGICIPFVSADEFNDTMELLPKPTPEPFTPVVLEPAVMKVLTVDYVAFTPKSLTEQILSAIETAFGIVDPVEKTIEGLPEEPTETDQVAVFQGDVLAIIPSDSKFSGLQIHEVCLPFQYGTDKWYDCEVEYEGK